MKHHVIGITGHYRSGKDTVCTMMLNILNGTRRSPKWNGETQNKWIRLGFADELKRRVAAKLHIPVSGLEEIKNEKPIRELLQKEGEDIHLWDDAVQSRLKAGLPNNNFIVPDVRYLINGHTIRMFGGAIVRVERPGFFGNNHISEQEQERIPVDYHICNDNTPTKLLNDCKNVLTFLDLI